MAWFSLMLLLFGLSWMGIGFFRGFALKGPLLDKPNQRSSHSTPTPRGAGIVFGIGWGVLLLILSFYHVIPINYSWFLLPILSIGLVGFWDDYQGLSVNLRLISQAIICTLTLWLLGESGQFLQHWIGLPLYVCQTIIVIGMMWLINLYNFMDGSDGIVAAQSIFVFAIASYMLFDAQALGLGILALGLVGLLAGFLAWNWPPARIFMGDSGSYFLGFMVGLYALASYHYYHISLFVWMILTSLFWFDATLTLLRRITAGHNWRSGHRLHAFQRLLTIGWSHRKLLHACIIMNMILGSLSLVAYHKATFIPYGITIMLLLLTSLYIAIEYRAPMFPKIRKLIDSDKEV